MLNYSHLQHIITAKYNVKTNEIDETIIAIVLEGLLCTMHSIAKKNEIINIIDKGMNKKYTITLFLLSSTTLQIIFREYAFR